ncbi:trehalose-phosphatase [Aeromicrobium sp. CF4.19]|uniref:trehalose-phosphatase n=1 Tax=Aeromicrobium sp. CF4.19 TaxID=3373082 RepID=UPI003EE662F9
MPARSHEVGTGPPDGPVVHDAVLADPAGTLLGLDFDGTLSHVVDDPTQAFAHPDSVRAVATLGRHLGQVAIITGRPVRQVLELGGFEGLEGLEGLVVCGQYGAERWDASTDELVVPPRPEAIEELAGLLPSWLAARGAATARIEDKGLAIAIHTRGLAPSVLHSLTGPIGDLAAERDLHVEPGRQVLELRGSAVDKGTTLTGLVHDLGTRHVVYAGDDLGDLPAFDAVDALRPRGVTGFLVCSASAEQDALVERSDLVLDGPDAVAGWLGAFADAVVARAG